MHARRLGIYTSSTVRTVAAAKQMLEKIAGCPLFEPHLILYREHTMPALAMHREVDALSCSAPRGVQSCMCGHVGSGRWMSAPAMHQEVWRSEYEGGPCLCPDSMIC
eukprot:345903-Pelagomonas_calceolata.AAC.1